MKKFLVTGGVLFAVMPAMALDLSSENLIAGDSSISCSSTQDPEFAVAHDSENPMDMQAVYVTNACDPTEYLSVSGNSPVIDNNGILTNATCETCTAGSYCPGLSDIAITNNQLASSYGITECPAGTYCAAGASNYTACTGTTYASTAGSSSCTNVTSGYYADKTDPVNDLGNTTQTQCPLGYRDVAAADEAGCTKSVDSTYCSGLSSTNFCGNFNHIANGCSTAVNPLANPSYDSSNPLSTFNITFGTRNGEPACTASNISCAPGYSTTNFYNWLAANPEAVKSTVTYCSPDGTQGSCTTQEPGTMTWTLAEGSPVNKLHFATKCSTTTFTGPADMIQSSISNTAGAYCWFKNIDLPGQPWFGIRAYTINPGTAQEALDPQACALECGNWVSAGAAEHPGDSQYDYLFGYKLTGQNFALSNENTMVPTLLAGLGTVSGNTANVCVPGTIYMDWGDVEDAGAAETCTYGESFSAPSAPTPEAGYKFLGWKVTSTTNND